MLPALPDAWCRCARARQWLTALLVQRVRQNVQRPDWHAAGPSSQEGALAGFRRLPARLRHSEGFGGSVRGGEDHGLPLAAQVPGGRQWLGQRRCLVS